MEQQCFLSSNLDELEQLHEELVKAGITASQMHVWSDDEAGVLKHHMMPVNTFLKTDIIRSTVKGAILGIILALIILSIPYFFKFSTPIGQLPFIFTAIIILGFCTWEGGLRGIQTINSRFADIDPVIHQGKHMLIIDFKPSLQNEVKRIVSHYPELKVLSTDHPS